MKSSGMAMEGMVGIGGIAMGGIERGKEGGAMVRRSLEFVKMDSW